MKRLIKYYSYIDDDNYMSGFIDTSKLQGCYVSFNEENDIAAIIVLSDTYSIPIYEKKFDAYTEIKDILDYMDTIINIIFIYVSEVYSYPDMLILDESLVHKILSSNETCSDVLYENIFGGNKV